MSRVIMSGALSEFDVPTILQAVSLSRQCTLLRLWDRGKQETGEIRLKAGQLLGARCGTKNGRAALHALLRGEHHSFRVERFPDPVNLPEPVGPLATLLLEMPHAVDRAAPAARAPAKPVAKQAAKQAIKTPPMVVATPSPNRAVISAMPSGLIASLEGSPSLEGALICKLPDCTRGWFWSRRPLWIGTDVLRDYVESLTKARIPGTQRVTPVTVELDASTLVIRPSGHDMIIALCFAAGTPLGLARLVVSEVHGATAAVLRSDAPTQPVTAAAHA